MSRRQFRVLVVDDNRAIHEDFQKVLVSMSHDPRLADMERALFDLNEQSGGPGTIEFALSFASQGLDAVALATEAVAKSDPFSVAFVDVRMPPGIDGIETSRRLWSVDPELQIVICTAYSDYSWNQMATDMGAPDRWVILKKPFDNVEVLQLAHALAGKWQLHQQAKAYVANLERTVAARTADLASTLDRLREEIVERERTQKENREIERRLEESQRLESLGVLAGGVAHDFNNILTGILVTASMVRMSTKADSDLHRHLEVIENNSRRAGALCEQLLVYAGRSHVEPTPIKLQDLVRGTVDLVRPSIPCDVEVTLDLAAGVPAIAGDPTRLRQAISNVLLNAVEALASAPRRITLRIGVQELDGPALSRMNHGRNAVPGQFTWIEVADTGSGMSAEVRRRMFEPFFTTRFTGRGLGLSAVLGIVHGHAGAVDVETAEGQGTTVRLYLPTVAPARVG